MVQLASGLGLIERVIVDQHFRQRDRIGRLMTAVALHPSLLGVGIDEDTAFVIDHADQCHVMGSGSVTIVDGSQMAQSARRGMNSHQPIGVTGMNVHVLKQGSRYTLQSH
jgi:cyanophycinase